MSKISSGGTLEKQAGHTRLHHKVTTFSQA